MNFQVHVNLGRSHSEVLKVLEVLVSGVRHTLGEVTVTKVTVTLRSAKPGQNGAQNDKLLLLAALLM